MRTFFSVLLLIIISSHISLSEWQYRFYSDGTNSVATLRKQIFVARMNGLTKYDLENDEVQQYNMMNTELPSNRINSLLKISDEQILVSTRYGLAIWEDGKISTDYEICKKYPGIDARKLELDSFGNIWTHSGNEVYFWKNNKWNTINLKDSINYAFDIRDLMVRYETVWAIYVNKSNLFYNRSIPVTTNDIKFAIVDTNGIKRIIDDEPFMKKGGSVRPTNCIDYVLWPKYDSIYVYNDWYWQSLTNLDINEYKTVHYADIRYDNNGKLWYFVQYNTGKSKIASFEIATSNKKLYFETDTATFISLDVTREGYVVAETYKEFYLKDKKDTTWKKIVKHDLGLDSNFQYSYKPFVINDTVFIFSIYYYYQPRLAAILNLQTGKKYFPAQDYLKYEGLNRVEIDKFGKGVVKGIWNKIPLWLPDEPLIYEADSAWVELLWNLGTTNPTIKLADDGHIYFNQWLKWDGKEHKKSYIATFLGNDIILKDMGFTKKFGSVVTDFECINNRIYALGYYPEFDADTLVANVTIHSLQTGENINYDYTNSDMKKYYYASEANYDKCPDEIPRHITADKDGNIWILTTKNLKKLTEGKVTKYEFPIQNEYKLYYEMEYDAYSNEILIKSLENGMFFKSFFTFSLDDMKWSNFLIVDSGIKSSLVKFKKLLDNNVWASDIDGYLYRYQGKGKFKSFDLKVNGYENLRFPINDFCIDPNNNMHLATEIGLLSSSDFLTGVNDNGITEENNIFISPNPASEYIEISGLINPTLKRGVEDLLEIKIYNTFGELVLSDVLHLGDVGHLKRIDISHLPSGIYIVKIGDKINKFIKE